MTITTAERFWPKVAEGPNDCWLWTGAGAKTDHGYGRFRLGGRDKPMVPAHVWAYEQMVAPVPAGLQLDHLCRVTQCVNPWHLDPVPGEINNVRSDSPTAKNVRKTQCPRGHSYSGVDSTGRRICHPCGAAAQRRYQNRRKS